MSAEGTKTKESAAASKVTTLSDDQKVHEGNDIIKSHAAYAAASAFIPIAGLDLAVLVGLQVRMLGKLSRVYGNTFSESWAKHLVGLLLTEVSGIAVTGSLLKLFPPFGIAAQLVAPVSVGAVTLALGRVFHQHYASGGTLLDFDPAEAQRRFKLALATKQA